MSPSDRAARRRSPVHATAPHPLGAADPRQGGPRDLRLVPPALAAWGAAAVALGVSGTVTAVGVALCCAAAVPLLVLALAIGRRRGPGRVAWAGARGAVLVGAAVTLLCAAAGGAAAGLHAADLRRGPLPRQAERFGEVTAEVEVTGDPRLSRPRAGGARPGDRVVVIPADAVRTETGDGARTVQRTPVLLLVTDDGEAKARGSPDARGSPGARGSSGTRESSGTGGGPEASGSPGPVAVRDAWLRLLPSARIRVGAWLAPPSGDGRGGQDIAAVLRVRGEGPPHVVAGPSAAQEFAGELRAGLREASEGLGSDARGLLPGLVVGDTSRLPPALDEAFRATDMTHLLAVSGANLTILLVLVIGPPGLAHRAERRGPSPRLGVPLRGTAVLGALLTLAFVVVCRPEPSVLRAAACGLVTVLALATGRRRSLLPALAAAVLTLVLYDPWLARDFGFLLSVLATGSLLTVAPRWSRTLRRRGVPGRLAEALAASAAAQTACAPVVAVLAAHVSLVAVPCNLLAEFAVAPATLLGFAALAAAPVAMPLAKVLAWLASWPVEGIAELARTGARLPGAEIGWPDSWAGAGALAVLTVGLLGAAARLRLPYRPWWSAACALVLVVAVLRPMPLVRPLTGWPPPGWRLVACDVGQGDALALAVDGKQGGAGGAVVVDTGPDPEAADTCLRELGVREIPLLVLTHFHDDHVRGLPGVLRGRNVGAVQTTSLEEPAGQAGFVGRTARRAGVPLVTAVAGERRRAGELRWEVLWPPGPGSGVSGRGAPVEGANDASVTLLVRTAGLSLLLAGDLEPAAQERMLAAWPGLRPVDVLKVPHHGSRYQAPALLTRLRPRMAFVSAGADNPYGHPSEETLRALSGTGALVSRTDENGAVALVVRDDGSPAVVTRRGGAGGGPEGSSGGGSGRGGGVAGGAVGARARGP